VRALVGEIPIARSFLVAVASRERSQWVLVVCAVALVALTIAVIYLWNTLRKTRGDSEGGSAKDVFSELCDAHDLNRLERALLLQLSSTYEMPQPGVMFVDPWSLEQASSSPSPEAHRYAALRNKLFGSLE
jgi:hypothetical protein